MKVSSRKKIQRQGISKKIPDNKLLSFETYIVYICLLCPSLVPASEKERRETLPCFQPAHSPVPEEGLKGVILT